MERTKCEFAMRLCGVALGLVGLALMPALAPAATAPEPSSALKAETESNCGMLLAAAVQNPRRLVRRLAPHPQTAPA
jgi:hypothetical protein